MAATPALRAPTARPTRAAARRAAARRRRRARASSLLRQPESPESARCLLEELVAEARTAGGAGDAVAVVAFSGGVDSSLAAHVALRAFGPRRALAAIGVSAALSGAQLAAARETAAAIGIRLVEVSTDEGSRPDYVANEGAACYECKTELYTVLAAAGRAAAREGGGDKKEVLILNGTNADDLTDPTRLGLLAATEHRVISPLATLPKAAVRMCARAAGLPNWDLAAAPCLRSRLALGVRAEPETLHAAELGEGVARATLGLRPNESMRLRVLQGGKAILEVEETRGRLDEASAAFPLLRERIGQLGLELAAVRAFKSGAVATSAGTAEAARAAAAAPAAAGT